MYKESQSRLYFELAGKYKSRNVNQSWLCYENALYHYKKESQDEEGTIAKECGQNEDHSFAAECRKEMEQLEKQSDFAVAKTAIVMLSYNQGELTRTCIESIREHNDAGAYELIVVDNASTDGILDWLREQRDIHLIENKINQGFPYGCNQGIAAAGEASDIFLLNNDTLVPDNAIFWLRMGLYESERIGAVGSVSNSVVNYQQVPEQFETVEEWIRYAGQTNVPMEHPYEKKSWLVGFAMLIRRAALEAMMSRERHVSDVALQEGHVSEGVLREVLDTRFSPGNFEDNDLSIRLLLAGYRLLLVKNSFIFHYGGKSFQKMPKEYSALLRKNRDKMAEKYGMDLVPFSAVESALVDLVNPKEEEFCVLEIGCKLGASLARIESRYPWAQVLGIEENDLLARLAENVTNVIRGDFLQDFQSDIKYDYIIMDGILHAGSDAILNRAAAYLKADGKILVSVRNAQCVKKNDQQETAASMTLEDITGLCNRCRLQIQGVHYRSAELSEAERKKVMELCGSWESPLRPLYEAEKYIFEIVE